jgi:ribose 5-phosphate isomerase B
MKIAIGNDHIGYQLKLHIMKYLLQKGHQIVDFGTDSEERTDYPIYGKRVADALVSRECEKGILICGTGVGISIAANKVNGIRAIVCSEPYSVRLARKHNDVNIVAFGARVIGSAMAEMIVDEFLSVRFEGGRHQKRIDMIGEIEKGRM